MFPAGNRSPLMYSQLYGTLLFFFAFFFYPTSGALQHPFDLSEVQNRFSKLANWLPCKFTSVRFLVLAESPRRVGGKAPQVFCVRSAWLSTPWHTPVPTSWHVVVMWLLHKVGVPLKTNALLTRLNAAEDRCCSKADNFTLL